MFDGIQNAASSRCRLHLGKGIPISYTGAFQCLGSSDSVYDVRRLLLPMVERLMKSRSLVFSLLQRQFARAEKELTSLEMLSYTVDGLRECHSDRCNLLRIMCFNFMLVLTRLFLYVFSRNLTHVIASTNTFYRCASLVPSSQP